MKKEKNCNFVAAFEFQHQLPSQYGPCQIPPTPSLASTSGSDDGTIDEFRYDHRCSGCGVWPDIAVAEVTEQYIYD